jgi:HTH-type transcriptional regulator/antitoxin HigA
MAIEKLRTLSDLPIPPGDILEEELEARGMTQKELAARLGRPAQVINEIVNAKKAITPDTALGLEKVLGINAQIWNGLEADYRMVLARNRERDTLAATLDYLNAYPIREMVKRGWLEAGQDKLGKLKALLTFLAVADAEPRLYQEAVGFRITEAAQQRISPGALAVWLRKGELDAGKVNTADYDEETFKKALLRIRSSTGDLPAKFLPEIQSLCAQAGIVFCMIPELPKSGANGATRWLTDRKAMIQMSIRGKWADIFWFTFFHEACHLLEHRTQRRIVIDGLGADPDMAGIEAEADRFARDFLISPEDWAEFCERGQFTSASVREFAHSVGIAPFIVVGRLQKEQLIPYSRLTDLKPRYQWTTEPKG